MFRRILDALADCWRAEPDPATLDTPDEGDEVDDEPLPDDATPEQEAAMAARYATGRRAQDRDRAIAAGLVSVNRLDGFESRYAIQAIILECMRRDAIWQAYGDSLN